MKRSAAFLVTLLGYSWWTIYYILFFLITMHCHVEDPLYLVSFIAAYIGGALGIYLSAKYGPLGLACLIRYLAETPKRFNLLVDNVEEVLFTKDDIVILTNTYKELEDGSIDESDRCQLAIS